MQPIRKPGVRGAAKLLTLTALLNEGKCLLFAVVKHARTQSRLQL